MWRLTIAQFDKLFNIQDIWKEMARQEYSGKFSFLSRDILHGFQTAMDKWKESEENYEKNLDTIQAKMDILIR